MKLTICLLLLTAAQGSQSKCENTPEKWQWPKGKLSTLFLIKGITWTNNEGSNLVDFELKYIDEKDEEKSCRNFKKGEAKAEAGWIVASCTGKFDEDGRVVPVKGKAAIAVAAGGLKTCDEQTKVYLDGTVLCPEGYSPSGLSCVEDEKEVETEKKPKDFDCAAGSGVVNLNTDSAKLSSQYDNTSPPIKAIDAKKGGNWGSDNCACTSGKAADKEPWWSVEFMRQTWLSAVQIQNRVDCCSERLVNFKITLDDKLCRHYKGAFFKGRGTVYCDKPVYGKLLKISLSAPGYLQLCDIVAIGGCAATRNIPVEKKTAALSTQYTNAPATYAVDGNSGGHWTTDKCACTSGSGADKTPWWKVDFQQDAWVAAVEIQNRIDCCWERLHNFKITVDDKLCHHYKGKFIKGRGKVMCDGPVFGKTLKINLSSPGYLQLCDVDAKDGARKGDESRKGSGPPLASEAIPVSVQSAALSSEWDPNGSAASKAVDEKKGGNFYNDKCACTKGESWDTKPWWKVDFVEPMWLTAVEIQNRVDCCSNRLKDFKITLDGQLCKHYTGTFPAKRDTVKCDKALFGRTLQIALQAPGHLQLCDVQPRGGRGDKTEDPNALKCAAGSGVVHLNTASAKLSTQYDNTSPPMKAIDAKKGGNWGSDNCACTNGSGGDKEPWWSVEFMQHTWLSAVQIQNRVDCCSERLVNFKITVDDKLCRHYKGAFFKGRGTVYCDEPVYGKLLKINLSSPGYLQLCDIVAIGGCAANKAIEVNKNTAALSTQYANAPASYAVDGNSGGHWTTDKCACTSGSGADKTPWWKVDFKKETWMSAVEIQNRIDCCWDRLHDFKITVDDKLCHHYKGKFIKGRGKVMCDAPVFGKTLKINLSSPGYLQLCDVDPMSGVKKGAESNKGSGPPTKPAKIPVSVQSAALSSEWDPNGSAASKAVDEKKGGNFYNDKCACTKGESWDTKPWWKVDFVEPMWLTAVEIQNRVDCCWDRLKDFIITLDGVVCASRKDPFPVKRDTITCTKPLFGKTLKIALTNPGHLQLCDVQPMGGPGV